MGDQLNEDRAREERKVKEAWRELVEARQQPKRDMDAFVRGYPGAKPPRRRPPGATKIIG
jgi:hypothetical protein